MSWFDKFIFRFFLHFPGTINRSDGGCEMDTDQCPEDNIIAAFVSCNLMPEQQAAVEAHLARCQKCREVVAFALKCKADINDFPLPPLSDL